MLVSVLSTSLSWATYLNLLRRIYSRLPRPGRNREAATSERLEYSQRHRARSSGRNPICVSALDFGISVAGSLGSPLSSPWTSGPKPQICESCLAPIRILPGNAGLALAQTVLFGVAGCSLGDAHTGTMMSVLRATRPV